MNKLNRSVLIVLFRQEENLFATTLEVVVCSSLFKLTPFPRVTGSLLNQMLLQKCEQGLHELPTKIASVVRLPPNCDSQSFPLIKLSPIEKPISQYIIFPLQGAV